MSALLGGPPSAMGAGTSAPPDLIPFGRIESVSDAPDALDRYPSGNRIQASSFVHDGADRDCAATELVPVHQLISARPERVPWLCSRLGMAARGRPTLVSGYGGSGKSLVVADLALAVAARLPTIWGGLPIELAGRVVWLDYEMGRLHTTSRIKSLALGRAINLNAVGTALSFGFYPHLRLGQAHAENQLEHMMRGSALLVIDSLRACFDGDEQDSKVRLALDKLPRLTERTGCAVLLIVHEGKTSEQSRGRNAVQRVRGSSAITDAASCVLSVTKKGNTLQIAPTKSSWTELRGPHAFRLQTVDGALAFAPLGEQGKANVLGPALTSLEKDIYVRLQGSKAALSARSLRAWKNGKERNGRDVQKALTNLSANGLVQQVAGGWEAVRCDRDDVPGTTPEGSIE